MTRDLANQQLVSALNNIITIPEDIVLTEEVSLRDDLGMDSLASLTFLMELEESIQGFSIDPDNLEERHFESLGAMIDYIIDNVAEPVVAMA